MGQDIELPNRSGAIDPRLDTPLYKQVRENTRLSRSLPARPPAAARTPSKKSPLKRAVAGYRALTRG